MSTIITQKNQAEYVGIKADKENLTAQDLILKDEVVKAGDSFDRIATPVTSGIGFSDKIPRFLGFTEYKHFHKTENAVKALTEKEALNLLNSQVRTNAQNVYRRIHNKPADEVLQREITDLIKRNQFAEAQVKIHELEVLKTVNA